MRVRFSKPVLGTLGERAPDSRKLAALYGAVRRVFPKVRRMAVALYDPKERRARTYLHHGDRPTPLALYEADLRDAPSLRRALLAKRVRVVDDMELFKEGRHEHTVAIRDAGFRSSAAFPIVEDGRVEGVVFFNARVPRAFPARDLPLLEVFAALAARAAMSSRRSALSLRAALRTASGMVHARDPETGGHLDRMARYSAVIARGLARGGRRGFDDARVREVEDFAPLHDVGKIGVPDDVLLKPGPLDPRERRVMRTHARKGRLIVDAILREFPTGSRADADALRQITEHHHEAMDGSGYPDHLRGRRIPIEARIIAVADVFDALTSARPYKPAWPPEKAFALLRELARHRLDKACVRALEEGRAEVERIRRRFRERSAATSRRAGRPRRTRSGSRSSGARSSTRGS